MLFIEFIWAYCYNAWVAALFTWQPVVAWFNKHMSHGIQIPWKIEFACLNCKALIPATILHDAGVVLLFPVQKRCSDMIAWKLVEK